MVFRRAAVMVLSSVMLLACTSEPDSPQADLPLGTTSIASTSVPPSTVSPSTLPEVIAPPGYRLIWRDEFAGATLDSSKWSIEHSTFGDGGNTEHCYEPGNVSVSDGLLVLTAWDRTVTCPNGSTRNYTSGMVTSENLATFTNGWFEVRARVPEGRGLWPAIWMSPNDDVYGSWPASGEIDLMEVRGDRTGTARVNAHLLDESGRWAQTPRDVTAAPGSGFADRFHTFALEWEESKLVFMVDGLVVHTIQDWSSSVGGGDAPFDQPFFFRLNLAVGGDYPGSPDASTPWPAQFEIDYVRVFEPVDG